MTSGRVLSADQVSWFAQTFDKLADNICIAILGKRNVVRLVLTCLLSEGHMLLEDFPGTGKTSLARALATTVHGSDSRIQFTPDLLPSDVTGVTIYDQHKQAFEFHPGPVLSTIVLADEINRASPKTQSALLEVMEEQHVTVDGVRHSVGRPFMVIATQNPIEQAGTYPLPEAQLDRFLMKTSLGYPDSESSVTLLRESALRDRVSAVHPIVTDEMVRELCELADQVFVHDAVLAYVTALAERSRQHTQVRLGLSMRGCLAYVRCAKTWAASHGRNYVVPDDIKELALPILEHRLLLDADAQFEGATVQGVIDEIFASVAAPAGSSERGPR